MLLHRLINSSIILQNTIFLFIKKNVTFFFFALLVNLLKDSVCGLIRNSEKTYFFTQKSHMLHMSIFGAGCFGRNEKLGEELRPTYSFFMCRGFFVIN